MVGGSYHPCFRYCKRHVVFNLPEPEYCNFYLSKTLCPVARHYFWQNYSPQYSAKLFEVFTKPTRSAINHGRSHCLVSAHQE